MALQPTDAVFAVPGENHIIDTINPETDRSTINEETLEQIQQRYPNAVRVSWESWRAEQIQRQNTPIVWKPTTERKYHEMLEVLPPIDWDGYAFLVGEPTDHSYETGAPRYQAYLMRGSHYYRRYYASNRPLTRRELRTARYL